MGNLEQAEKLEAYIEELGNEITNVKKASEYLYLIEKMQSEITRASATLIQSKDQIKLYQEILESKLELYHTIIKNIEAKQILLEQTQVNIIDKISELSKQHAAFEIKLDENKNELIGEINQVHDQINSNQETLILELNEVDNKQNQHYSALLSNIKFNKISLGINSGLVVIVILLVLLLK